jgi:hypothetical protein
MAGLRQILSNIDQGQHRADSGAPPAWASPVAMITEYLAEEGRYD